MLYEFCLQGVICEKEILQHVYLTGYVYLDFALATLWTYLEAECS